MKLENGRCSGLVEHTLIYMAVPSKKGAVTGLQTKLTLTLK